MKELIGFFNDSENINILTGISAIGTFIAALVAVYTLRLIRTQTKNSQRPNIVFGNRIIGSCFASEGRILKTYWLDDDGDENATCPIMSSFNFVLMNVGVGFAENVCFNESFDIKAAIKYIKEIDLDNQFEFSLDNNILKVTSKFDEEYDFIPIVNGKRELGSLQTVSVENDKRQNSYRLVDEYLIFLSCFGYIFEHSDKFFEFNEFPKLKFDLRFNDIDGMKYKSRYECSPFFVKGGGVMIDIVKKK
jgi:hypothetical protein